MTVNMCITHDFQLFRGLKPDNLGPAPVCYSCFKESYHFEGGGFTYFLFLPLPGEMVQVD